MSFFKKFYPKILLLSFLSGFLFALAWNADYLFPLALIAFVPFFWALHTIREAEKSFFKKALLLLLSIAVFRISMFAFFVEWLFQVTLLGASVLLITDILLLFLLLLLVLWRKITLFIVVPLFVLLEWMMQNLITLSPSYMFGYSWGNSIALIQYYSLLGIEGGSFILYLVNYAFFDTLLTKRVSKLSATFFGLFLLATLTSIVIYYQKERVTYDDTARISIPHTNIDRFYPPYKEHPHMIIDSLNVLAEKDALLITPEVTFLNTGWIEGYNKEHNELVRYLDSLRRETKQDFVLGTYLAKTSKERKTSKRIGYYAPTDTYYFYVNASVLVNDMTHIKTKQKYIAFFEQVPEGKFAEWLHSFVPAIGADITVSNYDRFDKFQYKGKAFNVLLCYEGLFPMVCAERAKGNQFLVMLANENWHTSEKCSFQYFNSNRANAIQTGLPIYRTSNEGYSAFINSKGEVVNSLFKNEKSYAMLNESLPRKAKPAFYTKIVGYSYGLALILLFLIVPYSILRKK